MNPESKRTILQAYNPPREHRHFSRGADERRMGACASGCSSHPRRSGGFDDEGWQGVVAARAFRGRRVGRDAF